MELVFLAVLLILMIVALSSGFPVAFSLPGSAILAIGLAALCGYLFAGDPSAYFAEGGPIQWISAGVTNFRSLYWDVERDTLIAIPLFIFMGIMLQRSKIAEDLLVAMAQMFGPVPGGLGISVVLVGALLAATTGIVGATVIAMGMISLPAMLRNNYSKPLATGTICASGTLGQIIPPSIVLIILADQLSSASDQASSARKAAYKDATGEFSMPSVLDVTSTSAGEMFMGALIPGFVLVGLYIAYILIVALTQKGSAPPVLYHGSYDMTFVVRVVMALAPPLTLIFVVLGSIILGVATVNQAGAIGAVGAMIMGGYRLKLGDRNTYYPAILAIVSTVAIIIILSFFDLNVKSINTQSEVVGIILAVIAVIGLCIAVGWSVWRVYKIEGALNEVMIETAKTTSMVFIILVGAAMLTSAFRGFGGEELVKEFLTHMPGGFWTQFIVVMIVIFLLGFFLDFIEIAVVVVPIVSPILLADPGANVTAVWLGVMVGLNIQTSFLTPPFGFALFYLRGVAPAVVKTLHIYKGAIPFIGLQILSLVIVAFTPSMVNYLPRRIALTSETAPPPMNPRMQTCLEEHLFEYYDDNQDELRSQISKLRSLDLSTLPKKQQKALNESLDKADNTFDLVAKVREAEKNIADYAPEYRPQHSLVRGLQAEIRSVNAILDDMENLMRRLTQDEADPTRIDRVQQQIDEVKAEKASLEAQIPSTWDETYKRFTGLLDGENKARRTYRSNSDEAYEVIAELRQILGSAEALAAVESQIAGLETIVLNEPHEDAMDKIKLVENALSDIPGSSSVKSPVSRARRAIKGKKPNPEKAIENLKKALEVHAEEVAWRRQAQSALGQALADYDNAIQESIGLRMQPRLSLDQATAVASCQAVHRDYSLRF